MNQGDVSQGTLSKKLMNCRKRPKAALETVSKLTWLILTPPTIMMEGV